MKEITKALIKFHKVVPPLTKNAEVKYGSTKFKYADLGAIIANIRPSLIENGLWFTQIFDNGHLITVLMHESGEELRSGFELPHQSDPKQFGASITYYKRYQLAAMLGLNADDDNDAAHAGKAFVITPEWRDYIEGLDHAGKGVEEICMNIETQTGIKLDSINKQKIFNICNLTQSLPQSE